MKYNPEKHHRRDAERRQRRTIRLQGYDYTSAGAYFVTICTHKRQCLFGEIVNGMMQLNEYGQIVSDSYLWLASQYPYVYLDQWVVMPNHLHGIIGLSDDLRRGVSRNAPTIDTVTKRKSLGRLIGAFKTVSTKQINILRDTPGTPVWQRNYYEHIIRNEESLRSIRQYIDNNPLAWQKDQLHPDCPSK
jgi:REP element-mobilizing transposase RayT